MCDQECIGEIGVVRRTRFDDQTQTWYAEAPLEAMVKVVQENARLRESLFGTTAQGGLYFTDMMTVTVKIDEPGGVAAKRGAFALKLRQMADMIEAGGSCPLETHGAANDDAGFASYDIQWAQACPEHGTEYLEGCCPDCAQEDPESCEPISDDE